MQVIPYLDQEYFIKIKTKTDLYIFIDQLTSYLSYNFIIKPLYLNNYKASKFISFFPLLAYKSFFGTQSSQVSDQF